MERVDKRLLIFVPIWLISEMIVGALWPAAAMTLMFLWVFLYGALCAPYLEQLWRVVSRRSRPA